MIDQAQVARGGTQDYQDDIPPMRYLASCNHQLLYLTILFLLTMRIIIIWERKQKKSIKNKPLVIPTLDLIIDNIFKAFHPRPNVVFLKNNNNY